MRTDGSKRSGRQACLLAFLLAVQSQSAQREQALCHKPLKASTAHCNMEMSRLARTTGTAAPHSTLETCPSGACMRRRSQLSLTHPQPPGVSLSRSEQNTRACVSSLLHLRCETGASSTLYGLPLQQHAGVSVQTRHTCNTISKTSTRYEVKFTNSFPTDSGPMCNLSTCAATGKASFGQGVTC